jgi:hypothetical protein
MTKFYSRTVKAFALTALALSSALSLSAQTCTETISGNNSNPSHGTTLLSGDVVCISAGNYGKALTVPTGATVIIVNGGKIRVNIDLQGGTLIIQTGGSYTGAATVESGGTVSVQGGDFSGSATVQNNGNINVESGTYSGSATVQNGGNITVKSGGSYTGSSTIQTGGNLTVKKGGSYTGSVSVASGANVLAEYQSIWNPSSKTGAGSVTVLAIVLQNFTATANGNAAEIRWSTASELNGKAMIVQHSVDGANFEDIKTVASSANSSSVQNYSCTDYNAANGVNYYRLKLVSSDAPVSYSAVVAVKINNSAAASVVVYPTAFTDHFTIKLNDVKTGNVIAKLYNDQGVVVLVQTLAGSATQVINTPANLATGLYILEVINGTEKSYSRLVKL